MENQTLGNKSFDQSAQQTSVLYCRLTDFYLSIQREPDYQVLLWVLVKNYEYYWQETKYGWYLAATKGKNFHRGANQIELRQPAAIFHIVPEMKNNVHK